MPVRQATDFASSSGESRREDLEIARASEYNEGHFKGIPGLEVLNWLRP